MTLPLNVAVPPTILSVYIVVTPIDSAPVMIPSVETPVTTKFVTFRSLTVPPIERAD